MKKVIVLFIIAAVGISSCQKGFLSNLQNNPNSPTSSAATPQLVLPGTLTSIINITNGTSYQSEAAWMGYWNYAPGYSFVSSVQNYVLSSGGPEHWDDYYGVLANLNFIISETSDPKQANYNAIANILEAVCFKGLVDNYNNVPYTQALKGSGNFSPSYDNGSDIYDSLVAKLDAAISSIQANLGNSDVSVPASDDIMFTGNMNQWLVLANTIKLKLLVQEAAVTSKAAYLSSEAASTASVGYLTSDALVNPGYSASQPSPMWGGFGVTPSGAIAGSFTFIVGNETAIDFYKQSNDPRLGYFYCQRGQNPTNPSYSTVSLPLTNNDYLANYLGSQNSLPAPGGSGIGPGLAQGPTQSAVFMLAAESYFIQAEATVRGWLAGGASAAQTLYQKGITASFEYLNVGGSTASADTYAATYYGQANTSFVTFPTSASSDSLIHTIITQKWAALNGISTVEAFNDWRRTFDPNMDSGYPIVPVSISPSNVAPHAPFRYFYPTEESTSNGAAWKAAGGPTIDVFNDKIFWMP